MGLAVEIPAKQVLVLLSVAGWKSYQGNFKAIGEATNNIAEYTALNLCSSGSADLKAQKAQGFYRQRVDCFARSRAPYKVKNREVKISFDQVQHLMKGL